MRRACMAIAVLLGVHAAGVAAPAGLATGKAAVEASDYLTAKTALAEALAAGTSSPDELAEIYRLTGIVAGALGDPKAATAAFQKCLALAPKAALPAGTSPKIARPFAAAQDAWAKLPPFAVKVETSTTPSVTIVIASDPLALVARVRALVSVDGKPEQAFDRAASERTTIELPAGARLDLRVVALDERGNRLVELGTKDVPIVIVGVIVGKLEPAPAPAPVIVAKPPPPPPAPHARPFALRWQLWGGIALALGGATTYFAIDAVRGTRELDRLNADSANHSFDEATSVESRTRRSVLLTNIGVGVSGAFAIGAAVLFATRPRSAERTTIGVAPVRDGWALVLGGSL